MAQSATIAFAQNLVNRYIQFKQLEQQQRQFDLREKRYADELQANRIYRQETLGVRQEEARATQARYTATEERMARSQESMLAERAKPDKGTMEYGRDVLNLSEEEAQLRSDREQGLAPAMFTPQQKIMTGSTMVRYADTDEALATGELLVRQGTEELQNTMFPSRRPSITEPPKQDDFFSGEFLDAPADPTQTQVPAETGKLTPTTDLRVQKLLQQGTPEGDLKYGKELEYIWGELDKLNDIWEDANMTNEDIQEIINLLTEGKTGEEIRGFYLNTLQKQ